MFYALLFLFAVIASFVAGAKYGRAAEAKAAAEFKSLVAGLKKEADKVL